MNKVNIIRFGSYQFKNVEKATTSFGGVRAATTKLPGMHGAYDEYGMGEAPSDTGNVRVQFYLAARRMAEMTALRDAVTLLKAWGVTKLYMQPYDLTLAERFCWARVNDIQMPEDASKATERLQPVTINFQVADACWYTIGTEAWNWGDGTLWGSGAKWGGSAVPNACSGQSTTWTETPGGSAATAPRISIVVGAGESASDVRVQRLIRGVVVDEVRYNATLVAGDRLTINCRDYSVALNNANAYDNNFSFEHPSWMRLEPGDNDVRVLMANSGDACTVYLRYYEVWR